MGSAHTTLIFHGCCNPLDVNEYTALVVPALLSHPRPFCVIPSKEGTQASVAHHLWWGMTLIGRAGLARLSSEGWNPVLVGQDPCDPARSLRCSAELVTSYSSQQGSSLSGYSYISQM